MFQFVLHDTYLLIYLYTSWSRVLLEKLPVSQVVKKFPAFYRTQRFITTFKSASHLPLSWARSIQSMSPISLLNIILPSMDWSSSWSPSPRFPHQKPLYTSVLPHTCYIPRPSHSSLTVFGKEYRSLGSSLCSFLHSPVTSSLLSSNIFLSVLFAKTLSLRSSLSVSDQVSHPYKTTGKIIVLNSLIPAWHTIVVNHTMLLTTVALPTIIPCYWLLLHFPQSYHVTDYCCTPHNHTMLLTTVALPTIIPCYWLLLHFPQHHKLYRVIEEEKSIFWKVILSVIVRRKFIWRCVSLWMVIELLECTNRKTW